MGPWCPKCCPSLSCQVEQGVITDRSGVAALALKRFDQASAPYLSSHLFIALSSYVHSGRLASALYLIRYAILSSSRGLNSSPSQHSSAGLRGTTCLAQLLQYVWRPGMFVSVVYNCLGTSERLLLIQLHSVSTVNWFFYYPDHNMLLYHGLNC